MKKRMSAGISRDVQGKVVTVHPVLWKRMEERAHEKMGTNPEEIKLTNQQVLTALVTGGEA